MNYPYQCNCCCHNQPLYYQSSAPKKEMDDLKLRDYFAAAALTGMMASPHNVCNDPNMAKMFRKLMTKVAYQMADSMIDQRNESNDQSTDHS